MPPMCWKLGLTIAAGVAVGALGGQATIAGMAAPVAPAPAYPRSWPVEGEYPDPAGYTAPGIQAIDYRQIADACDDCSDFDLGYRFAAAKKLRSTTDCMDYSWSYQRGCLAYLREG